MNERAGALIDAMIDGIYLTEFVEYEREE